MSVPRLVLLLTAAAIATPVATADAGFFLGYRDGPVEICVSWNDQDGLSTHPDECESDRVATMQISGELSAGAHAGSTQVCVLVDDDGSIHTTCSPCEVVADTADVRVDDVRPILCQIDPEIFALS